MGMVFPEKFLWGVSLSGFQFEMGDPNGRSVDPNTDWYVWVHDSTNIKEGIVSGDLPENGVDYWNRYEEDHEIARKMGLNAYRIGIEWSRIFPKETFSIEVSVQRATDGKIARIKIDDSSLEKLDEIANKESLNHYREIINDLRTKGFTVFVCLNHFTLPLWIHDPIKVRETKLRGGLKGWVDEKTTIEFVKYAGYMAWKLGDIVDRWATFNEPMVVSEIGYLTPQAGFPPGLSDLNASRRASVNMAIAHARSYDVMKELDTTKADESSSSSAEVGVIHNVIPVKPLDAQNELDVKAAEFMDHAHNHFFIQAASTGWLDENLNGRKESGEVKNYMGQRLDWIGVNYYTRTVIKGKKSILARLFLKVSAIPETAQGYGFSCKPNSKSLDGMPTSDFGWEVYPQGIVEVLEVMESYGKPLYITEHGIADARDALRPRFIIDHLELLDTVITERKIDLRGYFHWSLIDNYEWAQGFKMKFGLFSVDLYTKSRKARKSAEVYKRIIENMEVTEDLKKELKT